MVKIHFHRIQHIQKKNNKILYGYAAKSKLNNNNDEWSVLYDIKRVIGKKYTEIVNDKNIYLSSLPFKLNCDNDDNIIIPITYNNKEQNMIPQKICRYNRSRNEATAAAINYAYKLHQELKQKKKNKSLLKEVHSMSALLICLLILRLISYH